MLAEQAKRAKTEDTYTYRMTRRNTARTAFRVLDTQEVAGSNPASPTPHRPRLRHAESRSNMFSISITLRQRAHARQ